MFGIPVALYPDVLFAGRMSVSSVGGGNARRRRTPATKMAMKMKLTPRRRGSNDRP